MLALGLVRPYKQLEHAREAVDARRRERGSAIAGDASAFLSETEIDRALGESTVAVFPYRPELDQSGALLRALGAGVPAVVYDVGGLAEPVRGFGAGRVVAPDDVDGLAGGDARAPRRRGGARRGARGRRASARRADLGRVRAGAPRPLPGARVIFRRDRFAELVRPAARPLRRGRGRAAPRGATRRSAAYDGAERDEAEEAYGDFQLVLEAVTERLAELRDTYAATLDEDAARGLRAGVRPRRAESASPLAGATV